MYVVRASFLLRNANLGLQRLTVRGINSLRCISHSLGVEKPLLRRNSDQLMPILSSKFSMGESKKEQWSKDELKKRLTPIQYHVTQEKGTERAFTGKYNKSSEAGTYSCIVCKEELFSSETKFESGCGWPAFNDVLDQGKVKLTKDTSHVGGNLLLLIANPGMVRTEVTCVGCGAHLGHVFNDGPKPTRRRFCINSASLDFHAAQPPDL